MVHHEKTFDTQSSRAKVISPDTLFLEIHEGETLTVAESAEIAEWAREQFKGKYKVLTLPRENAQIEAEVRSYLTAKNRSQRVLADAIIITNLPHRLLADFYMKFNRPDIPTRFFKTYDDALQWLKSI